MGGLVLVGAGGHCKSVLDTVLRKKMFDKIVIIDSKVVPGTRILGCEVVGADDCLERLREEGFDNAFITVGSIGVNPVREKLSKMIKDCGFSSPLIIDPSAIVAETAVIGEGTFVGKNAVINSEVIIGRHCIINTCAIIEHESQVGDYSHISVGTIICGRVTIKESCMIGAGSTIIQCLNIGNSVVIGANSTVLTDVADNTVCYGIVKRK